MASPQFEAFVGKLGARGLPGAQIIGVSAAPTPSDGNDGDWAIYIQGSDVTLYGPKASGVWPAGTSLRGPTGLTGTPPDSEWIGTSLRFRQADGSWGDAVDLKGDQGVGDPGPRGYNGWSPVLVMALAANPNPPPTNLLVAKLIGWVGGAGTPPTDYIGFYVNNTFDGFTSDLGNAADFSDYQLDPTVLATLAPLTSVAPGKPGGRLTLTTGVPVLTAAVSGAGTIYYTPYEGQYVPLYDGTKFVPTDMGGELSQALTDNTKSPAAVANNTCYDLFVWNDAGTIRCTRGPGWNTGTARGTGGGTTELVRVKGILLNANAITNGPAAQRGTYVGTIRTNGTATVDWSTGSATAGGGAANIGIWNMYNRRPVSIEVIDSTASWAYTTATNRALNGSNGNRVSIVCGLAEDGIDLTLMTRMTAAAVGGSMIFQIGVNSTTGSGGPNATAKVTDAKWSGTVTVGHRQALPLGFNFFQAIEQGDGTNANLVSGSGATALFGKVMA